MDRRKKILLGLGILIIILVIVLVLFLFINKSEKTNGGVPTESNDTTTSPIEDAKRDLDVAKPIVKELLFTISYFTEKCPSPYLYIYNDNTYEYYDVLDKENIPEAKTGKIDYDLTKFAESLKEYPSSGSDTYNVVYKGLIYVTSASNNELKAILDSIDVVLDKCIIER